MRIFGCGCASAKYKNLITRSSRASNPSVLPLVLFGPFHFVKYIPVASPIYLRSSHHFYPLRLA